VAQNGRSAVELQSSGIRTAVESQSNCSRIEIESKSNRSCNHHLIRQLGY